MKPDGADWVVSEIEGKMVGFPADSVMAVTKIPPVTNVPLTPSFLLGIVNYNGEILPVFDSVSLLEGKKPKSPEKVVILSYQGVFFGMTIKSVIGLHFVPLSSVAPVGRGSYRDQFFQGTTVIDDTPIFLVALENLFSFLRSALETPLPLAEEK